MNRVFCIGNGESRQGFDLEQLRPHGKIYGCNAIYRDFTPDVLIAVDHGIEHEIYHSGLAQKIPCYFRNWQKVPAMHYEMMVYGSITNITRDELKDYYDSHNENERGNSKEFVFHGSTLEGLAKIIQQEEAKGMTREVIQKRIKHSGIHVSWIKEPDMSHDVRDVIPNYKDLGWAAGATSARVAVDREKPVKEIFMIGHDLYSKTATVNNLYKGSRHYVTPQNSPTPCDNWITQWKAMFVGYPDIKFYKVNEKGAEGGDNVNRTIQNWHGVKNLDYINYSTMLDIVEKK